MGSPGRRLCHAERTGELSRIRRAAPAARRGGRHRVLDIACGSGLAVELAAARGATVAGLDASARLIAVARDRSPQADLQVGDMHALPWADDTFDVVTSFRGIWGTTPDAVAEARRVLRPGGRLGLTVWGHIKASPGRVGARAVHAGQAGEGRQPGGDGEPRPARRRRGAAGQLGVRGRPAPRDPVRVGVRRPRPLRPRARLDRPGLRGHPGRGRGGVPGPRPRDRPAAGARRAAAAGRHPGRRLHRDETRSPRRARATTNRRAASSRPHPRRPPRSSCARTTSTNSATS